MDEKYDCTNDVKEHQLLVAGLLLALADQVYMRAQNHDRSKLKNPIEKELFDFWTPKLREQVFGSDEYKRSLEGMGEGVKLHYRANRHHPEHFENGVDDMNLIDVIEMVADWVAVSKKRGIDVDLKYSTERFGLSDQLVNIIRNTVEWLNVTLRE